MPIPISVVDAFSERPFRGNPAGVCLPPRPMSADWMQAVAAEMNLAETAFLRPRGPDAFDLRWFTPRVEVDLCGHATLASAHRLWEEGLAEGALEFHTRSGVLRASRQGAEIELDFPSQPPREAPPPPGLAEALGTTAFLWTGASALDDLVVEVADERTVRDLEPDFTALGRIPARGIVVTAAAARPDSGHDFVSRFFAPRVGIDEDPVTGSAHCALAPFWSARLARDELVGWQASARGGIVRTRLAGDRGALGGRAVTVWKGELSSEAEGTEAHGREAGR
jgi:PhzF family phenazine biosynthesis protein